MSLEDPKSWFDNWHLHFDWKGYGNNSFKRRQPHLDKLFRHFDLLQAETKKLKVDFQLYVILYDFDSYNDALFLNTPNPNTSEFPMVLPNLSAASTLTNRSLETYIDKCNGFERLYGVEDQPFCLLYKPGVGHPFQPTAANSALAQRG
jgi:hypothetical protein